MAKTVHGMRYSKEYVAWDHMKRRCSNPQDKHYKNYGAKGISVCERWRISFSNFLKDMGKAPSDSHSIDRFPDKYGNYEPGNCRWATMHEQQSNKTNNVIIEYRGRKITMSELSLLTGVPKTTLSGRIRRMASKAK